MKTFSGFIFMLMVTATWFSTSAVFAQDTIHLVNKKKIAAKVIEINTKVVLFKKFDDLSGHTRHVDKRDLVKIVYENGVVDTFNVLLARIPEPVYVPPAPSDDPRAEDYFRNFAFLTATDLFMGIFTVGFERTLKSGKVSIRIPLSFGMSTMGIIKTSYDNTSALLPVIPSGAYYFKNKIFSTGIDLNLFPFGQGTVKYFGGPAVVYGYYHYYTYSGVPTEPGNFTIEKATSPIFTIMVKNGVLIQPSKKFNIAGFIGIGPHNLLSKPYSGTNSDYYYHDTWLKHTNVEIGINVGYKF